MSSIRIAFIRHGPTAWNREKRMQGRADPPLDEAGSREVESWSVPAEIDGWRIFTSPLTRTRQTAEILFGDRPTVDDSLIEMSFGDWEGRILSELRAELGEAMTQNEMRGLDFQPPGGESPRDVQARVLPLLQDWAVQGDNRICVAHKGVIRAVLAKAFDWPMTGRPPVKLRWNSVHIFQAGSDGTILPDRLNVAMVTASENA